MFKSGMSAQLSINISQQTYYDKCNPSKCEFTTNGKRGVIEIFAVLAGLIGGFKVAIDLLVNVCCMKQENKAVNRFKEERLSRQLSPQDVKRFARLSSTASMASLESLQRAMDSNVQPRDGQDVDMISMSFKENEQEIIKH